MAAGQDEEEPADPDLEDPPLDWVELEAAVAEAREITAAEARDCEYAARMVFGGGWGVVGAAPGPRGPGQPGSAKSFPGEHASPAAAFGSGLALDIAPGCAVLAEFADAVAGPDDRYPGATDDEIIGVICAWARAEAHAAARKLAATAELIRRRPAEGSAPHDPAEGAAPEGAAGRSAAGGPDATRGWMPEAWDEFAVDELSCALGESRAAAEDLLDLAYGLAARLPGTMAALRDGILSQPKADIIAQATSALDPGEAAAAEQLVLGRAARLTRPGLRAAIARAVMEVAPKKAKKRREEEARKTRVERWMEGSGTPYSGLPGTANGAGPRRRPAGHGVGEGAAGGRPGRRHGHPARNGIPRHIARHGLPPRRSVSRLAGRGAAARQPVGLPAAGWPVPGRVRGPAEPDRPAGDRARPGRPAW